MHGAVSSDLCSYRTVLTIQQQTVHWRIMVRNCYAEPEPRTAARITPAEIRDIHHKYGGAGDGRDVPQSSVSLTRVEIVERAVRPVSPDHGAHILRGGAQLGKARKVFGVACYRFGGPRNQAGLHSRRRFGGGAGRTQCNDLHAVRAHASISSKMRACSGFVTD
jgi:hypothetical protein